MPKTRKAKIKSSGQIVEVYKYVLLKDVWVNYSDCATTYHVDDIEFLD